MHSVINHIAVNVYDLKKSTAFYRDVLHLQSIPEPFKIGKHSWFQIGPHCQLHLIEGAKETTSHHINNHLSFSVPSIETFAQQLKEKNIAFQDVEGNQNKIQTRPDGIKQIFFKDPDGYWIEVNNDIHP